MLNIVTLMVDPIILYIDRNISKISYRVNIFWLMLTHLLNPSDHSFAIVGGVETRLTFYDSDGDVDAIIPC